MNTMDDEDPVPGYTLNYTVCGPGAPMVCPTQWANLGGVLGRLAPPPKKHGTLGG